MNQSQLIALCLQYCNNLLYLLTVRQKPIWLLTGWTIVV